MANGIYGQVPQALRESRLTLRDIMTDIATTHAADAKLKLALDTQRGNLEIQKLAGEADLAKVAADRELRKGQLAERIRHNKAMESIAQPESEMLSKTDSMRNWILKYPAISSAMKDVAMKNLPADELDQVLSGSEAKMLFDQLSKNPGFFYRNLKGVLIDKLEGLMGQYQDPALSDADRQMLEEQYMPLHKQLERLDIVLGSDEKITPEEMKGIRDMAVEFVKAGDGTVTPDDAFEDAFNVVKKIRKAAYSGKVFPSSLKELMDDKAAPGGEAGAGDDKGSWKKYDTGKVEKRETEKKKKAAPKKEPTLESITDPAAMRRRRLKGIVVKGAEKAGQFIAPRKKQPPLSDIVSFGQRG